MTLRLLCAAYWASSAWRSGAPIATALAGILASFAAQDGDRVMTFPERPIIPPLDGGGAEAHRFAGRRLAPLTRAPPA